MILRRVIKHFRQQEWTAIFLDFLIVVIGVFVGLQVNNWNEAQEDKQLGRYYISRLMIDLQKDHEAKIRMIAYYDAVNTSAERTVALLNAPSPEAKALVTNAYRASEYAYQPQTRATWDTVVSSGNTVLLPQSAIENGLSGYYVLDTALEVSNLIIASTYRRRVRSLIPHGVQKAIREHCGDIRGGKQEVVGFQEDCDLGVDEPLIEATAKRLREDPIVIESLRYQFSILENARLNIRGDLAYIEQAIATIGEGQAKAGQKANP
jgi:hypothetical protein